MASIRPNLRSSVFAFKCKMEVRLSRLDFNIALRRTEVSQFFFCVENNTHYVCMRLADAITRTRFANVLSEVERKPFTNFKRINNSLEWKDYIFMGKELREGEGQHIKDTLKRFMEAGHPTFVESLSTAQRHITHMLRNPLRRNHYAPSVIPAPVTPPMSPDEDDAATVILGDSRSQSNSSVQTNSRSQSNSSRQTIPITDDHPQLTAVPDSVENNLRIRDTMAGILRNLLNVEPGFDLRGRLDDLNDRLDDMVNVTSRIRSDLARLL